MCSEDRELVERVLAGEPEAFEGLVRRYNRMAGSIAYAILKDFHLAEDAVQDAFLKAFSSLPSLRDPAQFKFWFAELVRSKALDALRRKKTASSRIERRGAAEALRAARSAEEDEIREELRARVRAAIEELPEADRLAVVLKHLEGMSYREIAELTGTTVGAVESRLFRARQALKRVLAPNA
ncbi:MAG: RNA polymerase sigma factor [Planctomycetota bacterium]